jgi:ribosomal protein S18 acetylase RimI-like enzyme
MTLRFVDVTDEATFGRIPPCADPGFDHRTCDYWEDEKRGSKSARLAWLQPSSPEPPPTTGSPRPYNPFAPDSEDALEMVNPFAPAGEDLSDNPFAPRRERPSMTPTSGPRKLALLGRGLAVFGSYAKVATDGDEAVAYAQFGPLSAYPRALQLRDLYPQLPQSPLPAVITCIATTAGARRRGHARALVEAVCADLAGRGFSAVEAYPEAGADPDATSAASVGFWQRCGFFVAIDDQRFPVMRRELE